MAIWRVERKAHETATTHWQVHEKQDKHLSFQKLLYSKKQHLHSYLFRHYIQQHYNSRFYWLFHIVLKPRKALSNCLYKGLCMEKPWIHLVRLQWNRKLPHSRDNHGIRRIAALFLSECLAKTSAHNQGTETFIKPIYCTFHYHKPSRES